MPVLPETEISPEQLEERNKLIEIGGARYANQYYGHIQRLLDATEKRIEKDPLPKNHVDFGYLEDLRERILKRMQKLGIAPRIDVAGYEEGDENPWKDWRE